MKRFSASQVEVESLKKTLMEIIASYESTDNPQLKIQIAILKDVHFRLDSEGGFDENVFYFFELVLKKAIPGLETLERRMLAIWPVFKASKELSYYGIHDFERFSQIWDDWREKKFSTYSTDNNEKLQAIIDNARQIKEETGRAYLREKKEEREKIAAAEREKEQKLLEGFPEETSVIVRGWLVSRKEDKQLLFELLTVLKDSKFSTEVKGKLVEQSFKAYCLEVHLRLIKDTVQLFSKQKQERATDQQLNHKLNAAPLDDLIPIVLNWLRLNEISSISVEDREKIFFKYNFEQTQLVEIIESLESLDHLKILQQFDCRKILGIIFEDPQYANIIARTLIKILRYFNEQRLLTEEIIAIIHGAKMPHYVLSDFHWHVQRFLIEMDANTLAKKDQQFLVQVFTKYFKYSKGDELRADLLAAVVPLKDLLEKTPNLLALIFKESPEKPLLSRDDEPLFARLSKRIISLTSLINSSDVIKNFIEDVLTEAPEALLKIEDWVYPEIEKFSATTRKDVLSMLKNYCDFVATSKIISTDQRPFAELKGDYFFKALSKLPDKWKANELVWKALCYKTKCMPIVKGAAEIDLFQEEKEGFFSSEMLVKTDISSWDPRTAFLAGRLSALFKEHYGKDARFDFITGQHYEQMYQSSAKICALAKFFFSFVLTVTDMREDQDRQQEADSAIAWLAKEENFEKILKLDPVVCHYLTEAIDLNPQLLVNHENLISLFALSESDFALVVTAIALREKINQEQLSYLITSPAKAAAYESFESMSEASAKKEFSQLAYASRVLFLCARKDRPQPDGPAKSLQLESLPDEMLQHIASFASDTKGLPEAVRQHIIAEHFAPVPKPS
ncbi:MAG: hypothetical protein K0S08_1316 [Gammaproteobacteria bacterium]|jgi:hypothetical protein|nr:hypothetical protein [Gammaproteobacteria bacterium]